MECAASGRGSPCLPGPPTRRCGLCGAVAYCSPAHQMSHWNDHKDECARLEQQMKHADLLNDFPFTFYMGSGHQKTRCSLLTSMGLHLIGLWKFECSCQLSVTHLNTSWMIDNWSLPSSLCPCTEPRSPLSDRLSSWKDYYEWRCLPLNSPIALLLHWPLTLYHCFQLSVSQSLTSEACNKLHIHYLGPEKELLQISVFGELLALIPDLQLQIEVVGPAVPQYRDGDVISLSNYIHCSDKSCFCKSSCTNSDFEGAISRTSALTLKLHKGFYHDRYKDMDSKPHLVVAPNAGVAAYSSWLPTIGLIKEMGIPAIFTDYCEEAAHLASSCITAVTGRPLRIPIQVNPFRQPMPVEDSALFLPCYSNCFLFGM